MIALMTNFPNTLPDSARGEDDSAYYQAFTYAVTAGREALLRFPDAPQANLWRWDLAYNLARTSDPTAGQSYSEIIALGLNSGETEISKLNAWFQANEPRLRLHMVETQPPSGYIRAYIIQVSSEESGSAFIWLLESSGAYRANDLLSAFDFVNPRVARWILSELDGNPGNGEEIAIYFSTLPDEFYLQLPQVYNLSRIPAQQLITIPELDVFNIGMEYKNYWAVLPNAEIGDDLVFEFAYLPGMSCHRSPDVPLEQCIF